MKIVPQQRDWTLWESLSLILARASPLFRAQSRIARIRSVRALSERKDFSAQR